MRVDADAIDQLFCGADDFSIYSLRALHALQQQQPSKVESISVVCRTDKKVGRGLKETQAVPIKKVATELGLRLYQIDTFRGWWRDWLKENPTNLVVAVSFGLLVPAGLLESAKYGGLNVHPSLLPELRGSAPIHRALLNGKKSTGVSLQTMHPTKFDHGTVLAQTEGLPIPPSSTPQGLINELGPKGANLLRKGIQEGLFVPPVRNARESTHDPPRLDLASKITPQDRQIDWNNWRADEILLRNRVLGDLWDTQTFARCQAAESPQWRVTFHGKWVKMEESMEDGTPGKPRLVLGPFQKGLTLGITTVDGHIVVPQSLTIEGKKKGKGLQPINEKLRSLRKASSRQASP